MVKDGALLGPRLYDCLAGGRIQMKRKLSVSQIWKRNVKVVGIVGNSVLL